MNKQPTSKSSTSGALHPPPPYSLLNQIPVSQSGHSILPQMMPSNPIFYSIPPNQLPQHPDICLECVNFSNAQQNGYFASGNQAVNLAGSHPLNNNVQQVRMRQFNNNNYQMNECFNPQQPTPQYAADGLTYMPPQFNPIAYNPYVEFEPDCYQHYPGNLFIINNNVRDKEDKIAKLEDKIAKLERKLERKLEDIENKIAGYVDIENRIAKLERKLESEEEARNFFAALFSICITIYAIILFF